MEISKLLTLNLWLIAILITVSSPSDAVTVPRDAARSKIRGPILTDSGTSSKTLKNANRSDPKRGCGEVNSRSECGRNPRCRWCRSDALDDMCFPKSEALRLPSQVFSCEF